jgi:hypothetical protein
MKSTVKTIIIAAVSTGFFFSISGCEKHTCPTYSKIEVKNSGKQA